MDLAQVETFLVLAEELHFGRTAERLRFTQPKVSRLVAALEREVGGALFERTSRRVRLTPLGAQLRDQLAPAYAQLHDAVQHARATAQQIAGTLRIGFSATTEGAALNRLVAAFEARHPQIRVLLQEVPIFDPYTLLRAGRIDATFNWLVNDDEPDLTAGPAVEYRDRRLAVSTRHRLAARTSVSVEDIAEYEGPKVLPPFPQGSWYRFLPPRAPSGRPIRRTVMCSSVAEVVVPIRDMPPIGLGPIWCSAHENARIRALAEVARGIAAPQARVAAMAGRG
ncbi:LysR family transcriptional regulator [Micromonospora sp. CPCC 205371]|nr:LysR family transcriptional regulator [Micromonospora sp. CPCC 205371]